VLPRLADNNLLEKLPSDLAEIVTAWPNLPEHIKVAVKALVEGFARSENGLSLFSLQIFTPL